MEDKQANEQPATVARANESGPENAKKAKPEPIEKTPAIPFKCPPEEICFEAFRDLANKEGLQLFYFDLDEQGNPIKLGDGSFGAVYRIRNRAGADYKGDYAVKIYYAEEESASGLKEEIRQKKESEQRNRFIMDMNFWNDIRTVAERERIPDVKLSGVLKPVCGTELFKDSPAFKTLFKGKNKDINVSPRAIVMERYDGTLKDLLENRQRDNTISSYDVLKGVKPSERIPWILPLLSDVIDGLRTLYYGDFAHLDLKPSNIFYRMNNEDNFELVIADMGYLYPKDVIPFDINTIHPQDEFQRRPMLGTLHYRSPEQKDDYDVCDAEVKKLDKNTVELIIRDPKFNHSIIGKDDFVYFSKSIRKMPFSIKSIEKGSESNNFITRILITNHSQTERVSDDKKTQVVMRKRQQVRTDLFGLGALAYDMITCGDSPERFYERIRLLDTPENNIAKIMEKYERVESFNSSEPIAQHIFSSLKHKGRYPAREFVEFILKCMLYNVSGTFYDQFQNERNIFNAIKEDFIVKFHQYPKIREKNPLVFQYKPKAGLEDVEPEKLSTVLLNIQEMGANNFADRLSLGFLYLKEIFKYIDEQVFREKEFYFAEFYPANLIKIRDKNLKHYLRCHNTAFRSEKDYYHALLDGELQLKLFTDRDDYFVANYISHIRKPIQIWPEHLPEQADDTKQAPSLLVRYAMTARSYAYDTIRQGDWILEYREEYPTNLYKIEKVDAERMELSLFESKQRKDKADSTNVANETVRYIYFKHIDRLEYYLHILGMYIHQLFFFGTGASNTEVLALVDKINIQKFRNPRANLRCVHPEEVMAILFPPNKNREGQNPWEKSIYEILLSLVHLYARLTFHQLDGAFYENLDHYSDPEEQDMRTQAILAELKVEIINLQEEIEHLLNVFRFALDGIGLPLPKEFGLIRQFRDDVKQGLQLAYPKAFNFVELLEKMIYEHDPNAQITDKSPLAPINSWWGRLVKSLETGA